MPGIVHMQIAPHDLFADGQGDVLPQQGDGAGADIAHIVFGCADRDHAESRQQKEQRAVKDVFAQDVRIAHSQPHAGEREDEAQLQKTLNGHQAKNQCGPQPQAAIQQPQDAAKAGDGKKMGNNHHGLSPRSPQHTLLVALQRN